MAGRVGYLISGRGHEVLSGAKLLAFTLNPNVLKTVPLFASFTDVELRSLMPSVVHRRFDRGASMVRRGDPTDALYLILSGRAKVYIDDPDGREVILTFLAANEYFGEMGLFDDEPRSANVEVVDPCEVLRISKSALMQWIVQNERVALVLIRDLVKRLRETDRRIESLALLDVLGRVARLFLDMANEVQGVWVVERAPTKQDIARLIGASREMVSRCVTHLRDAELIATDGRRVVLLDRGEISKRAQVRETLH